jgi:hypothetical protein
MFQNIHEIRDSKDSKDIRESKDVNLYEMSRKLLCLHESILNSKYYNNTTQIYNSFFYPSHTKVFRK